MADAPPIRTVIAQHDRTAQVQGSLVAPGPYIYVKVGGEDSFASIKLTLENARLLAQMLILTAVELEDAS